MRSVPLSFYRLLHHSIPSLKLNELFVILYVHSLTCPMAHIGSKKLATNSNVLLMVHTYGITLSSARAQVLFDNQDIVVPLDSRAANR